MTTSSLEIGQTFSGDVHVTNGRKLFSAGHVITEQTLRVLKIWGVRDVPLHEVADSDFKAAQKDKINDVVAERFTPAMQMLFRDNDIGTFPISCLLRECVALADKAEDSSDGFFSYLHTSSMPNLQSFNSIDLVPSIDLDEILSGYDGFPEDLFALTNMLNDVYVTSEAVVAAVDKNKRVKDKLLKICESLIHVSNCKITSVYSCTSFLGNRTVLYLAIMLVYIHHVQDSYNSAMMMHYCRYAITTGVAARYIASSIGVYRRECFFSSGLLRDVGCVFYSRNFTDEYEKVRQKVLCDGLCLCAAEEKYMKMNHAELGGRILKWLGFPASMEKSVQEHHTASTDITTKEHAVMHIAEIVAKALTFDPVYDVPAPVVNAAAWEMLNITEATFTDFVKMIYIKSKEIIRLAYAE
ncbi:HDOD domain-containing protein [Halodesulfovibrio marinisediminis]|uniref:HD-like signal output (HDOD) domain, no enzymatic activity n=1 Tax=Halodesulfovibrio marinisediminis DSM 17456 TaxID=1121457 RepID=A0A1N6DFU3_9BACT|nr:HDOD domain-containing protein [Halodesulfovibrio marinisediminis]SIN69671.1 HD-like signal output (HDOD) domain, no enzymatic activity [Halodesulfovibrio marinisediminis DSM 17456]